MIPALRAGRQDDEDEFADRMAFIVEPGRPVACSEQAICKSKQIFRIGSLRPRRHGWILHDSADILHHKRRVVRQKPGVDLDPLCMRAEPSHSVVDCGPGVEDARAIFPSGPPPPVSLAADVQRRERLGGWLNFYHREAA